MKLFDLLNLLKEISVDNNTNLYIVGGLPRDKFLGKSMKINDIDFTTGNNKVFGLAKEVGFQLRKYFPEMSMKEALDKHVSIYLEHIKLDFSSNFITPGIDEYFKLHNIESTDLNKEVWSRDFTCNSLLMNLEMTKVKDLTKRGIPDIKNKLIKTILPPDLAFKFNTNRIIRVIYLSSKLGFKVDSEIINWIKNNREYINKSTKEYLSKNINKALEYNPNNTVFLIDQMNLWDYIPINEKLLPYYNKYNVKRTLKTN